MHVCVSWMGSFEKAPRGLSFLRSAMASCHSPLPRRVRLDRKGAGPTIVRAMMLNCGALASYDQVKEGVGAITGDVGGTKAIVAASLVSGTWWNTGQGRRRPRRRSQPLCCLAGLVGSVFSLPFDYVKTQVGGILSPSPGLPAVASLACPHTHPAQIQRMKPGHDGKLPFQGPLDCVRKTIRQHGPLRFYAGFPTYSMRIAPVGVGRRARAVLQAVDVLTSASCVRAR